MQHYFSPPVNHFFFPVSPSSALGLVVPVGVEVELLALLARLHLLDLVGAHVLPHDVGDGGGDQAEMEFHFDPGGDGTNGRREAIEGGAVGSRYTEGWMEAASLSQVGCQWL